MVDLTVPTPPRRNPAAAGKRLPTPGPTGIRGPPLAKKADQRPPTRSGTLPPFWPEAIKHIHQLSTERSSGAAAAASRGGAPAIAPPWNPPSYFTNDGQATRKGARRAAHCGGQSGNRPELKPCGAKEGRHPLRQRFPSPPSGLRAAPGTAGALDGACPRWCVESIFISGGPLWLLRSRSLSPPAAAPLVAAVKPAWSWQPAGSTASPWVAAAVSSSRPRPLAGPGGLTPSNEGYSAKSHKENDMTPTVKAPHTYTDWLRAHTWAQIMDERNAEGLQWRWERSTHMAEHGVTAGPLDAAGHITYQVQSASDPDRHYHVTIEKGCTCPDKKASFGWCKHRFAAWRYQKWLTAERR